jgi:hypothetical protein
MFNCCAGCMELTVTQSIIHAATESTLGHRTERHRTHHRNGFKKKKLAHGWRRNVRGLGRQNPKMYHTPIQSRPEQASRTPWRQNMPLGPHPDAALTSRLKGPKRGKDIRGRMLRIFGEQRGGRSLANIVCQHQVCC